MPWPRSGIESLASCTTIAHSVSLMVVQAAAAEQMLATDPQRAREPIFSIQESGRQAVLELRR
jgi:hypothetical protein